MNESPRKPPAAPAAASIADVDEKPSSLRCFRFSGLRQFVRVYAGEAEALANECDPDGSFTVQALTLNRKGPAFFFRSLIFCPSPDPWWIEVWNLVCWRRGIEQKAEIRGNDAMRLYTSGEFWEWYQFFGKLIWTMKMLNARKLTWAELDTDEAQKAFMSSRQMVHLRNVLEPAGFGSKRARGRPGHPKLPENVLQLISYVELYRLSNPDATLEAACDFVVVERPSLVPASWGSRSEHADSAGGNLKREHARSGINLLGP